VVCFEQHPDFFRWASTVLNIDYQPNMGCSVITNLANDERILAVVIYNNFTRRNCEISIASDGAGHWMTRPFLKAVFGYPFLLCKLRRITGVVEDGNERALRLNRHLGFVTEGRLRHWFGDKDGIVMGLLPEDCRWIR
jgi:RimJ/RimL family protein N-acetyltransferase